MEVEDLCLRCADIKAKAATARGFLRSAAATRPASRTSCFPWRPFLFFLGRWAAEAPGASSLRFPLTSLSGKMAPTASSPEAKLVAMSRSAAAKVGMFWPNSRTKCRQVVLERKA